MPTSPKALHARGIWSSGLGGKEPARAEALWLGQGWPGMKPWTGPISYPNTHWVEAQEEAQKVFWVIGVLKV